MESEAKQHNEKNGKFVANKLRKEAYLPKKSAIGISFTQKKWIQGLSNPDFIRTLQNDAGFTGCFMWDEKLPKDGCFIFNLDEFTDPRTHWVAVYNNKCYISFGLPPP